MQRALIIGCGYTGSALARRLAGRGVQVAATQRDPQAPLAGVALRQLDLLAQQPLVLPEARDAVVYYMVSTLYRRLEPEAPHLEPLQRLVRAFEDNCPKGLIYLSSTSVYGDRDGQWVDETSAPAPQSPWGVMRLELEQAVWQTGGRLGIPACVARLPEIYGPGRGPTQRLQRADYAVRYPQRFSNRIHLDDLVWALDLLGQRLQPELLLLCDDCPAPTLEVYQYAARLLGLDTVPQAAPQAGGDANVRGLQRDSKRCNNRLFKEWLGQELHFPSYREGIRHIVLQAGAG